MSVVLEAGALAKALKKAAAIVAASNTIPILANVRIETTSAGLQVLTTDLDVEYCETVPLVSADGELATTVEAKRLAALAGAAAKGAQISLAMEDRQLAVKAGRSRWKLNALPVTDFPKIPALDLVHRLTMPGQQLASALARVLWSRSTEPTRYYLNGPLWHAGSDGMLRLVATNGHTLASTRVDARFPAEGADLILGPKFCMAAQSIAADFSGSVDLEWSASKIRMTAGECSLLGKAIDGTFPDYRRVIPCEVDDPIVVDPEMLRQAVRRIDLVGEGKTRTVRIGRSDGIIVVSTQNAEVGSGTEEVPADVRASFEVGFNSQYLDQVLTAIGGDSVTIHHADATSFALVRRTVDDGALAIVGPMR
ncbi:DNA polymerase III subunit beta [Croceicoccus sp. BE223]|uniref:DNA polymerase III subunit beta n=1 Tax=Croceicoccus sp. BE223 TaxID=2817716 RepID=UPI00285DDD3D|nr:DNA polymerase III subunit beta [Croceicoccus sp. BE223]MDR7101500.1 DNA polymerase-3 subunit beta [Croceicoccus sp. BE223]